jgi:methylated-DNA-protein-cysteine methyltransferase-like protein
MSRDETDHVEQLYRAIYAVVRRIPAGRVATYGQVAELAGIPGGGRVAGAALKVSSRAGWLPWQRVIGKAGPNRGRIAIHDPVGAAVQRQLLDQEGVAINDSGLIALDRYGWLPGDGSRRPRRAPAGRATAGSARAASPRRRPRSASTSRASSIERGLSRPLLRGKAAKFTPPRVASRGPAPGSPVRIAPGRAGSATAGSARAASPRRRPRSASTSRASSSRR